MQPRMTEVAKPDGGTRRLVRLHPVDDQAYEAAIAAIAPRIDRRLGQGVRGNRLGSSAAGRLSLAAWRPALAGLRRSLGGARSQGAVIGLADVRECYASIGLGLVENALVAVEAPTSDRRDVLQLLERLHACQVPGLPIGPPGSAVLANGVLADIDSAIADRGISHLRWVDDFAVLADTDLERRRGMDAIKKEHRIPGTNHESGEDGAGREGIRFTRDRIRSVA